jgi:hypothetical protein
MTPAFVRAGALLLALAVAGAMAGCGASPNLVPNPTYQAWSSFEPGSSATFQYSRKSGETKKDLRITQRLVEKNADRVLLERTVLEIGGATTRPAVVTRKSEPARIDPRDNPRTRPDATVKELCEEGVTVKDRTFACRVLDVEVHAVFGEPLPSTEDLHLRTWVHPEVPGGTVKMNLERHSPTHDLELSGQLIEFQAAGARP